MDRDRGGRAHRAVRRPSPPRAIVSRRRFVLVVALGAGSALAGCGVRLDLTPEPAPTPTRRPAPDEPYLLAVIADLRDVIASERRLVDEGRAGKVATALVPLHERQLAVLVGRLTNDGVPTSVITAGPTGGGTTPPGPGTEAATTPAQLASRLADLSAADWADLAAASAATRDLVAAAYGMRLAGAALLGGPVPVPDTPSPRRAALVARTAPLVYAFEVVAAQTTGQERDRALGTLSALRRLLVDVTRPQGGGPDLPDVPGGWALPFPVTTPEDAGRLATQTLSAAVDAATDVVGPAPTGPTLEDVGRWSARVQSLATAWGVPLLAFPGTTR